MFKLRKKKKQSEFQSGRDARTLGRAGRVASLGVHASLGTVEAGSTRRAKKW